MTSKFDELPNPHAKKKNDLTPKRKGQVLSNTAREILTECAQLRKKELERLHWNILPFMPREDKKATTAAQQKILTQIAQEGRDIDTALEQLNLAYLTQFEETREDVLRDLG